MDSQNQTSSPGKNVLYNSFVTVTTPSLPPKDFHLNGQSQELERNCKYIDRIGSYLGIYARSYYPMYSTQSSKKGNKKSAKSSGFKKDKKSVDLNNFYENNEDIASAEEVLNVNFNEPSMEPTVPDTPRFIPSESLDYLRLPQTSWFCNTCRKPRDECVCICSIS